MAFWTFFTLLHPKEMENQNFEKMKKMTGHIIILYMCTINENRDAWFLRNGAQQTEFFVILGHFCPFTTLTT